MIIAILWLIMIVFTSCNYNQMADKFIPKEKSEYGKKVLEAVDTRGIIPIFLKPLTCML